MVNQYYSLCVALQEPDTSASNNHCQLFQSSERRETACTECSKIDRANLHVRRKVDPEGASVHQIHQQGLFNEKENTHW
jgi:hypothetical protein